MPFINDYIPDEFKKLFKTVYIDSEYTGKNIWQFILGDNGLETEYQDGLTLLGGAGLKFSMAVPYGEDHRNGLSKIPFVIGKKNRKISENR